jgi:ATP-dependent Zn protease
VNGDLRFTAYHEAGHAVVGTVLGLKLLDRQTLTPAAVHEINGKTR